MIHALEDCRSAAAVLQTALGSRDPAAIIAATERLAAAVVTVGQHPVDTADPTAATAMIGDVLALLERAAVQVNMLRAGTRQRIDNLCALRGTGTGIAPQTYHKVR